MGLDLHCVAHDSITAVCALVASLCAAAIDYSKHRSATQGFSALVADKEKQAHTLYRLEHGQFIQSLCVLPRVLRGSMKLRRIPVNARRALGAKWLHLRG